MNLIDGYEYDHERSQDQEALVYNNKDKKIALVIFKDGASMFEYQELDDPFTYKPVIIKFEHIEKIYNKMEELNNGRKIYV